jgi:hypothetical protein
MQDLNLGWNEEYSGRSLSQVFQTRALKKTFPEECGLLGWYAVWLSQEPKFRKDGIPSQRALVASYC